ncbi:MAG: tetratricopeptide repeat protein [Acidobacteriaceae bacterium]|jgi:tetratricopeptide (TPR) repeat protein|nr:tetratricopeptide repeat protein [Acidobacteriaceae bacterium]
MSRKALGLTVAFVLLGLISVAVAQSRRVAGGTPVEQLTAALNEGRYDQIPEMAAQFSVRDPDITTLVARALIARGRYQDAEAMLRPAATQVPTSDAALELGLLLHMQDRPEAQAILQRVAPMASSGRDPRTTTRGARALGALGRAQEAYQALSDAADAAPRDSVIRTALGELALEKFDQPQAYQAFQNALRSDDRYVPAMIGLARTLEDENPKQATETVMKALAINPSCVDAHLFLARQALDAGRRDEAREAIEKALEVNPNSLEGHALLAGVAYIEDKQDEYAAEIGKALAIAPRYGEAYRVVAEIASHNFRYDDAAAIARKGVALDPQNPLILSDMGIHLLRTGEEAEARQVLEKSFQLDDFNRVTFNLLQMLDTLDTFTVVRDGDLIIKMHKDEAAVLKEYAVPLAHQALDTLSKNYQFTPKGPFLIEIFPKHDDFAVRTAGLPGLVGALGVCFGRVVTLDSPHARPGEFQWEATLWHELAHVITLQMSNNRVPRWLTEGISVYEEKLQRPEWGRTMDMEFASLMNKDQILTLSDLNAGFTDPRTIGLAYFEASLLVEHIVQHFGDAGMQRLLRAYGQGLETEAALKSALDTDLDAMQESFDKTLDTKYGKLRAALQPPPKGTDLSTMPIEMVRAFAKEHPESFGAQMYLGEMARKAGETDEAARAYERAAALVPIATGDDSPHVALAELALQRKDPKAAMAAYTDAMNADFDNISIPRMLAELMKEQGVDDVARLRPVYQRIVAIDPFDADAHTMLGRLALKANQNDLAVREFTAVVALGPVDQAAAQTDLAESYFHSGNRTEARRHTLAALEVAPSYERAQDLLLKLAEARP